MNRKRMLHWGLIVRDEPRLRLEELSSYTHIRSSPGTRETILGENKFKW